MIVSSSLGFVHAAAVCWPLVGCIAFLVVQRAPQAGLRANLKVSAIRCHGGRHELVAEAPLGRPDASIAEFGQPAGQSGTAGTGPARQVDVGDYPGNQVETTSTASVRLVSTTARQTAKPLPKAGGKLPRVVLVVAICPRAPPARQHV